MKVRELSRELQSQYILAITHGVKIMDAEISIKEEAVTGLTNENVGGALSRLRKIVKYIKCSRSATFQDRTIEEIESASNVEYKLDVIEETET